MRLNVNHTTTYRFDPAMRGIVQSLRLTPSEFDGQKVEHWAIMVEGAERGAAFRDGAGDWLETVTLRGPVEEVSIVVTGTVETSDLSGVVQGHKEKVPPEAYLRPGRKTKPDAALSDLAAKAIDGIETELERAHALAAAVKGAIDYVPNQTNEATTAAEALAAGRGVCQDHSHAVIAAALSQGMPARYVTGYLHASGDVGGGEASHAWAEIHVKDLGWVGFDASNGVCPDEKYIRLGSGTDSVDAAPIRGVSKGAGTEALNVDVSVVEAAQ